MPRKKYPSDHRRYFRVMEDILDNDGYRNLSSHDKVAWIDLLALFNRRKAHLTGNSVVLAWSTAMEVLGSRNRRGAVATASRLRREVDAQFARVDRGLLCLIPKWSEMQGLTPRRLRRDSGEIPPPTPTPTPTPIEERDSPPFGTSPPPEKTPQSVASPPSENHLDAEPSTDSDGLGEHWRLLNLLAKTGKAPDHRSDRLLAEERRLWLLDHIAALEAKAEETGQKLPGVALAWWSRYLASRRRPGEYGSAPLREYYARARDHDHRQGLEEERQLVARLDAETEAEGIGIFQEGFD